MEDWSALPRPHPQLAVAQCYVIEAIITCQLVLAYISTTHLLDNESRILCCLVVGMSAAVATLFAVCFSRVVHQKFIRTTSSTAIELAARKKYEKYHVTCILYM